MTKPSDYRLKLGTGYEICLAGCGTVVGRLEPWDGILDVRLVTFWFNHTFKAFTMHPVKGQAFPKHEDWITSVLANTTALAPALDFSRIGRPILIQKNEIYSKYHVMLAQATEYRLSDAKAIEPCLLGILYPESYDEYNRTDIALLRKWRNNPLTHAHLWKRFTNLSKLKSKG